MQTLKEKNSFNSVFISLGIVLAVIALLSYVSIKPLKSNGSDMIQYAILFPPGTKHRDMFDTVVRSGARPVRGGAFEFIMIAASKDTAFKETIKRSGAVLVFSPIIKGGCIIENQGTFKKA